MPAGGATALMRLRSLFGPVRSLNREVWAYVIR